MPQPVPGEALVKVRAAGICGSDLHSVTHGGQLTTRVREAAGFELSALDRPVVLGHELCAEVVRYGPGSRAALTLGYGPGSRAALALGRVDLVPAPRDAGHARAERAADARRPRGVPAADGGPDDPGAGRRQ